MRNLMRAIAGAAVLAAVGCGPDNTCHVVGRASFKGEPLTGATVSLYPAGRPGPGAVVDVTAGGFEVPPGRELTPGPYVLRVTAPLYDYESENPKPIAFEPYETRLDLSAGLSEVSIDVPEPAAKK